MKLHLTLVLALLFTAVYAQDYYFPERNADWQELPIKDTGWDKKGIEDVVAFAKANEYSGSRDLRIAILEGFKREPFHDILGKTKKRGGPAGMILKNGKLVASWGDTKRVDMTFSVTKSFLSTMAGLAVDKNLISSVDDKVGTYVWDNTFKGPGGIYYNKTPLGKVLSGEEKTGQIDLLVKAI